MARIPTELQAQFAAETRQRTAQSLWVMSFIALVLYPPTFIMDWISFPDHFAALTVVRFSTTFMLALFVIFQALYRNRDWFVRRARWMVYTFAVVIGLSLDSLSLVVGGPETPYYAGLNLLLLGVMVALPWSLLEMGLLVLFIIGQYDLAMLVLDPVTDSRLFFVANYFYVASSFIGLFWTVVGHELRSREFLSRKRLEREKERSEELLLNVLPKEVADELKAHGRVQARHIDSCSILFTDFVGFTKVADHVQPDALVESLDRVFSRFDDIVTKYNLEKLKTIGDAYMCAGGVLGDQPDHLLRCILAGLEMVRAIDDEGLRSADGSAWRMRLGIHPGPVVAGVIGQKKFAYDLWGDTVNTASRLESSGQPHSINLATSVYKLVEDFFEGVDRGFVPVRGKGPMAMTRVTRIKPRYSKDRDGWLPNDLFHRHVGDWLERQERSSRLEPLRRTVVVSELAQSAENEEPLGVLAELTSEDRELLLELAEPIEFEPGQVLVEQGQSLKMLLLIMKGLVGVRVSRKGISIEVGLLHPGEIVGELSFVSWEPASATVVALDKVVALRLDLDWMESITASHPKTGVRLYHSLALVLAQRVRETNARLFEWRAERDARVAALSQGRSVAAHHVPESLTLALDRHRTRLSERGARGPEELLDRVRTAQTEILTLATQAARRSDDGEAWNSGIGAYVLRELFSLLMRSVTMEWLYAKPLARALDYVVTSHIHENTASGHGPLGEAMDAWFLEWTLARAVRGCRRSTIRTLASCYRQSQEKEGFAAAVLDCGAAPELFDILHEMKRPGELQLTCLDPDLSALSTLGQRAAREGLAQQFAYICSSALDPRTGPGSIRLPAQSMLCLPVLAERIDNSDFVRLLDELHANLRPGGLLVLGILQLPDEARFVAEMLLEWPVGSWSEEAVRNVVKDSAFAPSSMRFVREEGEAYYRVELTRP